MRVNCFGVPARITIPGALLRLSDLAVGDVTLAKLGEMGIDCVQGYLIGEPRPLENLV